MYVEAIDEVEAVGNEGYGIPMTFLSLKRPVKDRCQ
jgi:hypothetical protein